MKEESKTKKTTTKKSTTKKTGVKKVVTGVFGADMKIDFINDGPVTIILECKDGKIL